MPLIATEKLWQLIFIDATCTWTIFLGGRVGDDVDTWLDGTPDQIEEGSFGRDFLLTFISSKPDDQCNAQNYSIFTYSKVSNRRGCGIVGAAGKNIQNFLF